MGLSGRKTKQRIGDDPRNLTWADDAARFGSSYLSKFGWDASKGLGAEGDGRLSHVKVSQKLDMLGIGADHKRDPNGIAWKQNKDFENVLKRLNDTQVGQVDELMKDADGRSSDESSSDESVDVGKKRKGRRDGEEDGKKNKKKKHLGEETATEELTTTTTTTTEVVRKTLTKTAVVPRHRAHRARAIAAKNMASKSASHISEILGIAPVASSSTSTSPYDTSSGTLTPISDELEVDKITTSTKSLGDYFKEKLQARSKLGPSPSSDSTADEGHEAPRMGLGASRLRFDASSCATVEYTETRGMTAFASLKSASLLASFSLASSTTQMSFSCQEARQAVDAEISATIVEVTDSEQAPSHKEKKDKKHRKDKKGKNKSEESEEPAQEQDDTSPSPSTSKKEKKSKRKDDEETKKEEHPKKRKNKDHKTDESSKKKKRKHSEDSD